MRLTVLMALDGHHYTSMTMVMFSVCKLLASMGTSILEVYDRQTPIAAGKLARPCSTTTGHALLPQPCRAVLDYLKTSSCTWCRTQGYGVEMCDCRRSCTAA
eukprot:scpid71452/ scgid32889/ 